MIGVWRGLSASGAGAGLLCSGSAGPLGRRSAALGGRASAGGVRLFTTESDAEVEDEAKVKADTKVEAKAQSVKKEKKKKEKKKKEKEPAKEEAEAPRQAKGKQQARQYMTFEEHKEVSTEYIAEKLQKKLDVRASESWLRRWTRKAMLLAYAKDGGPAHEYMREHGLTDTVAHKYEMLRVMHTYNPLAHKAAGNQDPRTMSNAEWVESKQNTLTRMMASEQFHNVFPDVIKKFTPKVNLLVEHETKEAGVVPVLRGNEVPPFLAKVQPTVRFQGVEGHYYTLLMVDPDAPARIQPDLGPFLHWLVGNVPSTGAVEEGETIAAYLGPGPPKGTDFHRYVYILFDEGVKKVDYAETNKVAKDALDGRSKFNTASFVEKYGLRPQGIVFFTAEHDAYVTELYRSLGMDEPIFVDERAHRVLARKDNKYESGRFLSWKVLDKE